MLAVILAYDQLLFRPLVAWSAKFRFETTAGATAADPWLLRLMRRTRLLSRLGDAVGDAASALGGLRLAFRSRRSSRGGCCRRAWSTRSGSWCLLRCSPGQ